ncbi:helix-turn-helix domain-containing protein [Streptomyces sp. L7]
MPAVVHTRDPLTVHGLVPADGARELARTRFAPLDRAGSPGAPVLVETLRTWLTLHGSWDRTAAALQVHRNTVRHRLARVAELLDVDLQDPGGADGTLVRPGLVAGRGPGPLRLRLSVCRRERLRWRVKFSNTDRSPLGLFTL